MPDHKPQRICKEEGKFNAQGLCTKYNDFMDFMCTNDIECVPLQKHGYQTIQVIANSYQTDTK